MWRPESLWVMGQGPALVGRLGYQLFLCAVDIMTSQTNVLFDIFSSFVCTPENVPWVPKTYQEHADLPYFGFLWMIP